MAKSLKKVKWHDPAHAATAFLTVMIMPLTYSIAYGLLAGIITWIVMQIVFFVLEKFGISRPSFEEDDETRLMQTIHPHPSRAITRDDNEDDGDGEEGDDEEVAKEDVKKVDKTEHMDPGSESEWIEA